MREELEAAEQGEASPAAAAKKKKKPKKKVRDRPHSMGTAPGTCTAEARGGGAHGGGLRMHHTRSSPTAATPHVHCPAHAPHTRAAAPHTHRTRTAPYTHRACPAPGELVALTLTLTLARR